MKTLTEGRLGDVKSGQFRIQCIRIEIVEVDSAGGGCGLTTHLLRLTHKAEHVTHHRSLRFLYKKIKSKLGFFKFKIPEF